MYAHCRVFACRCLQLNLQSCVRNAWMRKESPMLPLQIWGCVSLTNGGLQRWFQTLTAQLNDTFHQKSVSKTTSRENSRWSGSSHSVQKEFSDATKRTKAPRTRSDVQLGQLVLRDYLEEKGESAWTAEDWDHLSAAITAQVQSPWQVMCMHTLFRDQQMAAGRSLMKYMETQPGEVNKVVLTFYIGLLGTACEQGQNCDEELMEYYQRLLSLTDVFNAASLETLIPALSNTKYYTECLPLVEKLKETSTVGRHILSSILKAALRHREHKMCRYILSHFEDSPEPTQLTICIPTLVEACLSHDNSQGLDLLMEFMQKHSLSLPKPILAEVLGLFHRYQPDQWTGTFSRVHHKSGRCLSCGVAMQPLNTSQEDFQELQAAFLQQVVVGGNIFYKTTPEEMNHFKLYVKKNGPFDVVIDGLNVLHTESAKGPRSIWLEKAVAHFTQQGLQVLILGSKMLIKYIPQLKKINPKPLIYMCSTTKADDVFFLYAALHSGRKTLIMSKDKLRNHKFCLEPRLRPVFHKWLLGIQLYHWCLGDNNEFEIGNRHLFDLGPVENEGSWHIPLDDTNMRYPFGNHGVLCLQRVNEAAQSGRNGRESLGTFSTDKENGIKRKSMSKKLNPRTFDDIDQFSLKDNTFSSSRRKKENYSSTQKSRNSRISSKRDFETNDDLGDFSDSPPRERKQFNKRNRSKASTNSREREWWEGD